MKVQCLVVALAVCPSLAADPFATQMLGYNQGTQPVPGFIIPSAALGEPSRMTGSEPFLGAVTPFNPPYLTTQIVSIGEGGSLTLGFDHPVVNDPLNPFGLDLLIFGNTFYHDPTFSGIAAAVVSAGGGVVEVSQDLNTWVVVPGALADSIFPTLGYSDLTEPYPTEPGAILSDFTRPVDPALNAIGLNFAQISAAYAGSGGGTGIDLAATGLNSIQYIRISNPIGSGVTVEIDAVSDIPAPGSVVYVLGAAIVAIRRRRLSR